MGPDDYKVLGKLLMERKVALGKKQKDIEKEMGTCAVNHWHDGSTFPSEDKLPRIAEVYEVSLEELSAAYKLAKEAREEEKKARKAPKIVDRKSNFQPDDYGTIATTSSLSLSNQQVQRDRYSRYR